MGKQSSFIRDKGSIKFNRDIEQYMNNHGFVLSKNDNKNLKKVNVNIPDLPTKTQNVDTYYK